MIIRRNRQIAAQYKCLLLTAFLLLSINVIGQNFDTLEVRYSADPNVYELVEKHIKFNRTIGKTPGYRILIFSDSGSNSKQRAFSTRAGFMNRYGNVKSFIFFEEPNYKVRVGDFRTYIDAENYLQKILNSYPGAFVVKDMIEYPKL